MKTLIADIGLSPITTPSQYDPGAGAGIADYTSSLEGIISNVLVVLTVIAGITFMLWFLLGGLNWISAGGKSDKIENAKAMMTNGAIGLIIVALSYAIVWIVGQVVGIPILEPGELLNNLTWG